MLAMRRALPAAPIYTSLYEPISRFRNFATLTYGRPS